METLNNDQMRIFNAGQSKNDTYLAELIADRIYEIITQHTLLSKTELCYIRNNFLPCNFLISYRAQEEDVRRVVEGKDGGE